MQSTLNSQSTLKSAPVSDPLLDAPLSELLADHGVELVESSITDAGFFGAYVELKDGSRVLSMPAGRSEFEHDTVARMLLSDGLQLGGPRVPEPLMVARPASV
ncbi:hypothetical protein [Streptomyces atriruber]|uniref:hypothetical protein n=1 Tax=Streptomyces atriruber TaxID=545121 RepID=UPI0006E24385|nr:hypothetical protein [Streptomyces atriruber]